MKKIILSQLITFTILVLPLLPLDWNWWTWPLGG